MATLMMISGPIAILRNVFFSIIYKNDIPISPILYISATGRKTSAPVSNPEIIALMEQYLIPPQSLVMYLLSLTFLSKVSNYQFGSAQPPGGWTYGKAYNSVNDLKTHLFSNLRNTLSDVID